MKLQEKNHSKLCFESYSRSNGVPLYEKISSYRPFNMTMLYPYVNSETSPQPLNRTFENLKVFLKQFPPLSALKYNYCFFSVLKKTYVLPTEYIRGPAKQQDLDCSYTYTFTVCRPILIMYACTRTLPVKTKTTQDWWHPPHVCFSYRKKRAIACKTYENLRFLSCFHRWCKITCFYNLLQQLGGALYVYSPDFLAFLSWIE